ncbi:MAG: RtcB family protein [Oscillospiraceae bacterium]|nr:RtcB family protein [Oscillospiraceae bacterium]
MTVIQGKYNTAYCYCETLEDTAAEQIRTVCDDPAFAGCRIRIMPDVHAGKGCTIGTTMTITDKIVPGMVGVDIGCGMETVRIAEKEIDFEALDRLIHEKIPAGQKVRNMPHPLNSGIDLTALRCARSVDLHRASLSIGTLGGGNHFIEVDRDEEGNLYLVVHSGSRHLGTQVAEYYQQKGFEQMLEHMDPAEERQQAVITGLKAGGRTSELKEAYAELKRIKAARKEQLKKMKDLAYVEGQLFEDYIHDMKLTQAFAALNRQAMTEVILRGLGLTEAERFTTIHNYIDTEQMILRKGSVSAAAEQKLLIPINMRDGSLVCIGKGNPDWNCSAPHGAGRLMSRGEAHKTLSLEMYRQTMAGIYTTCVTEETLDESPMAYKSMDEIVRQIRPTAEIIAQIRPVYNFKAAE